MNFPKNTYFHRTPPVAASDHYVQYVKKYCQKLLEEFTTLSVVELLIYCEKYLAE